MSLRSALSYNDAGRTLVLLEELRNGKTNSVIGSLESNLDNDVYWLLQTYKEAGCDSNEMVRLEEIREYHAKYPSSNRLTYQAITQALASIKSRATREK